MFRTLFLNTFWINVVINLLLSHKLFQIKICKEIAVFTRRIHVSAKVNATVSGR